jgi:alpha-galactosidase
VIQRGFSHFLPPELVGAHIGPPRAHTTGRQHTLAFRGAVALTGHLGVEWNLLDADPWDLDGLRELIDMHKHLRPLLHGGRAIRLDHPDPAGLAHAVIAADGSEAVVSYTQLRTAPALQPMPLRVVGLLADTTYEVLPLVLPGQAFAVGRETPTWWTGGLTLSGRQLAVHGVQLPVMAPESSVLLALRHAGG